MPGPILRQYLIHDFDNDPQVGSLANQSDVYVSDNGVSLVPLDLVTGLTQDGTYYVDYEFKGGTVDAQNSGVVETFRIERSNNGNNLAVYRLRKIYIEEVPCAQGTQWVFMGSDSGDQVALSPTMEIEQYSNCIGLQSVEGMETKMAGLWQVTRTISGPLGTSGPTLVRDFNLRTLSLQNARVEKEQFDPMSEENTCRFKADVVALPVGWQPTGDVQVRLTIFAPGPSLVLQRDASFSVTSPDVNGKVGEVDMDWDGMISGQDEPVEGVFQLQARAYAPTPGAGTTQVASKDAFVRVLGCDCKCERTSTGNTQITVPLPPMLDSPVGPGFNLNLSYCSARSGQQPQSLGHGWQGVGSARVFEPAGQNGALIYRGESGRPMRWNLQGSNYVAAFDDNYVEIEKNAGNPNATYVVTFQDQSRREFDSNGRLKRDLDRNGQAMNYTIDPTTGRLESMTNATGQTLYWVYDSPADVQPRFIRALNPVSGRQIEFSYNAQGRLASVTTPGDLAPETTQFSYSPQGLLQTVTSPTGLHEITYYYDSLGRVLTEERGRSQPGPLTGVMLKDYYYDQDAKDHGIQRGLSFPAGAQVVEVVESDNQGFSPPRLRYLVYNGIGNLIRQHELVFPDGVASRFNTTYFEYNDPLNSRLLTRRIMPNGFTLTMTYNAQGNLATLHESFENTTTEYRYTEDIDSPPINPKLRNLLREIHRPTVTVEGVPTTYPPTILGYDSNGNLTSITDAENETINMVVSSEGLVTSVTDRRGYTTNYNYDPTSRRLLSVVTPGGPNGAPARTTTFTYDSYGNLTSVTEPGLPPAEFTYDGQDRLKRSTSPLDFYSEWTYDQGLLTSLSLPPNQASGSLRRKQLMTYDLADRLQEIYAQIKDENEPSPYTLRVAQVYDGLSQPLALFREQDQQLKNTLQDYDRLGRITASSDFLARVTTVQHADYCTGNLTTTARGVEREVSYDERCRLREVKTQDEVRQFEYDELNRLTMVTMASRYAWPQGSPTEGAIYAQGYSAHQTRYRYDSLDRIVEVTYPGGETVSYSYDVDSNLVQLVDIHGKITEYDYYADGRLLSVTHELQQFEYTYDAVGRLDTVTYPASTQLVLHHSWDDDGRLESLEYRKNNQPFQRFDYTYDDSGNRISMVETNPSNVQTTWAYGYDWLNRLTSVSRNGQPQLSYTYDESDNRRSMTLHPVNEVYTFRPDVADQLEFIEVSVNGGPQTLLESFDYDPDGNLETRTKNGVVTRYVWDTHNQLRQIRIDGQTVDTALYDHEGVRRLQKNSQGQQKAYSSGGMSLADQRPSGPISFLQGHQLLGVNEDGQFRYFVTDALSSVRLVVDDAGNVLGAFAYDAFGVPDTSASPPPAELRAHSFQGGLGVRNEGAGLYYARHRWYASDLGRWLSADPIGFAGGLNQHTFVSNQPVNYTDPEGLYIKAYVFSYIRTGTYVGDFHRWHWETYKSADEAAIGLSRASRVKRIDFGGHGSPTFCGTDYSDANAKHKVFFNEKAGHFVLRGDHDYNLDTLVEGKGLEEIRLDGCQTAGGSPDPIDRFLSIKAMEREGYSNPGRFLAHPTNDNVANKMSSHYRIRVRGVEGIYQHTGGPGDTTRNPLNRFKWYGR